MAGENESKDESKSATSNAITVFGKLDAPQTGSSAEPLTIDLTAIESRIEPPHAEAMDTGSGTAGAQQTKRPWDTFAPLAASLVAAILVGAFAGAAATYELSRNALPALPPVAALGAETQELQDKLARLTGELAAFKAGAETANRIASQQLTKIGERLDRAEKAQAEPAAKLAKLTESLDRLERRAAADVTGSVTSVEKQQSKPSEVDGWKLREYHAGRALLESRSGALFDVIPGSTLPGIGKIEAIKRIDGKIVVTTQKGVIASAIEPPRRPYYRPYGY